MANALVTETSPYSTPHCFLPIWQNDEKPFVFNGLRLLCTYLFPDAFRLCFHAARHTNATLLLYKGVQLATVQKLLGHRNIKTTQVYGEILPQTIIKELKKCKF